MLIVLIVVVFIILGLADFPELISSRRWYEVAVLACLYAGVFILAVLQATRGQIPSPMKAIHYVVENYLHLSYPPLPG